MFLSIHLSDDACFHVSSMEQPRVEPCANCSASPVPTHLMTDPDCWHWRPHHTHSHPLATLEAMLHLARHSSAAPSLKKRPVIADRCLSVVLLPQSSCSPTTRFTCCHGLFVLSYSPFLPLTTLLAVPIRRCAPPRPHLFPTEPLCPASESATELTSSALGILPHLRRIRWTLTSDPLPRG